MDGKTSKRTTTGSSRRAQRFGLLLLLLVALAALTACEPEPELHRSQEPFYLEATETGLLYEDHVNGCVLTLPAEAEADTSLFPIRTVFSAEGWRLQLFVEPELNSSKQRSYVGYSNKPLENGGELTVTNSDSRKAGPNGQYSATVNAWSRRPLSRLHDDYPNAVCVDVCIGSSKAVTLLLQYRDGVDAEALLEPLCSSLQGCSATAKAQKLHYGDASTQDAMDAHTRAVFEKLFGEQAGLSWGIFEPTETTLVLETQTRLPALEEALNYKFTVSVLYMDFACTVDPIRQRLSRAAEQGIVTELTVQTTSVSMLFDVLDGQYDAYLRELAQAVSSQPTPVLMRLGNEMNGDWCSWCAYNFGRDGFLYTEFYRYIHDFFRSEGVENAIWVWNPNHRSLPNYAWNNELVYYPGDAYVDVVGLTAYNTGSYYSGETWQSFSQLYTDYYAHMSELFSQPLMITEFSCSGIGGDKVQWVRDMFAALDAFPRLRVAVWWNSQDLDWSKDPPVVARSYQFDDDEAVFAIFREKLPAFPGRD